MNLLCHTMNSVLARAQRCMRRHRQSQQHQSSACGRTVRACLLIRNSANITIKEDLKRT